MPEESPGGHTSYQACFIFGASQKTFIAPPHVSVLHCGNTVIVIKCVSSNLSRLPCRHFSSAPPLSYILSRDTALPFLKNCSFLPLAPPPPIFFYPSLYSLPLYFVLIEG